MDLEYKIFYMEKNKNTTLKLTSTNHPETPIPD